MSEEDRAQRAANSPADGNESAPNADPTAEQLQKDLQEAQEKGQTYLDLAQRTQADFVNYRRRVEQERADYIRSARADAIQRILPTLDDLERAVQSVPPDLTRSDWVQGILLIEKKLRAALESEGVRPIEATGKVFDPYEQEAVAHEPSTEVATGLVTRIWRPGYTVNGKIIRPAQVVVSSGPPN